MRRLIAAYRYLPKRDRVPPGAGVWAALVGLALLAAAAYVYLRVRLKYRRRALR